MKNKTAKKLMLNSVKSRGNGECYIANSVSIQTCDLKNGSVICHSTYIGDLDSLQALDAVCELVVKLSISKKEMNSRY